MLVLCMWLQIIDKVKVTYQGKGHIKVKVKKNSLPILYDLFCLCFTLKKLKWHRQSEGQYEGQGEMKLKINSWCRWLAYD